MAAHPVWGNGAIVPESRRQRDLLPLPLPPESAIASSRALSRATVAALNHLNAGFDSKPPRSAGRAAGATAAQRRSLVHVDARAATFLATVGPACDQNAWANFGPFEANAGKRGEQLRPYDVDLPKSAGSCDPASLVPVGLWRQATNTETVFGSALTSGAHLLPRMDPWQPAGAYAALTARELACGKLGLSRAALA